MRDTGGGNTRRGGLARINPWQTPSNIMHICMYMYTYMYTYIY